MLSVEKTNVNFSNVISEDETINYFVYEYFYNGGGVSLGDINNDGLIDIYFTGNMVSDKLYLNKGNMVFEDITETAIKSGQDGWHSGTTMADVNGDGFLDIYVCRSGYIGGSDVKSNLLYINNGDLTFTEQAKEFGLADTSLSTQAAFFDYDLDGDLDVYVMNYPKKLFSFSKEELVELYKNHKNESDHFYKNENGKFVDASFESHINNHSFGLGLSVGDVNNDGYPDMYVSNDYEMKDFLFINRNGVFSEEINQRTKHISYFGMGTDIADFNNDGDMDIIEMDMAYPTHNKSKRNMASMSSDKFWGIVSSGNHFQYMVNTLQLNNGNGTYSEIGQLAKVAKTDWSWAALFADFDMDGNKDLVVTNGFNRDVTDRDFQNKLEDKIEEKGKLKIDEVFQFVTSTKVSNYIFKNKGDLSFKDYSKEWGFDKEVNSNGIAYADLDNDGDLDLVVNNLGETSSIYENQTNESKNYLTVKLKGTSQNQFAIGAKVTVETDEKTQVQELFLTRGFQSSVAPQLTFGLGVEANIKRIEVRWPDKKISEILNVEPNQVLSIDYNSSSFVNDKVKENALMFESLQSDIGLDYKHDENFFNDFDRELLLPHILSRQGPGIAVGDVNGDGLSDVYFGGAKESSGAIYVQNAEGKFTMANNKVFENDKMSEDLDALFLDVDNDKDLDLYVTSGGNDYNENDKNLQDRLYLNDGKGSFSKTELPKMYTSTKVVKSADIDGDGDLDLFVGGRLVPGKYPFPTSSYVLINENGKYIDKSDEYLKENQTMGMVTDAEIVDINKDGKIDIAVVGEWMGLTIFINKGGFFEKLPEVSSTKGLWYSIEAGDFDNDGDVDFVAGNLGTNSKFKASEEKPFNIYGHDFDENGKVDIVLSSFEGDKHFPVRGKECSTQQMPFISEKFPTYKEFAEAEMESVYGDKLNEALHLEVTGLYSSVFLNDGLGNFTINHLPKMAQISPIQDMIVEDVNNDGNLDIIAAGNMYGAEVETVRYDAGRGICLIGNGKGDFTPLTPKESGLFVWNNVKSVDKLSIKNIPVYIFGVNNGIPIIVQKSN